MAPATRWALMSQTRPTAARRIVSISKLYLRVCKAIWLVYVLKICGNEFWAILSSARMTGATRQVVPSPCRSPSTTTTTMPEKVIETRYPLIDADPYAGRVVRYFRPSDYAVWGAATGAFPAALYFWGGSFMLFICGGYETEYIF